MAPGALQLFPPPSPPHPKIVPSAWPTRTSGPKNSVTTDESAIERMESAKSQADFHELVIRINSNHASPVEIQQLHSVEAPKKAHLVNPKTPPQQTDPFFPPPPRSWTASPKASTKNKRRHGGSPLRIQTNTSPAIIVNVSQKRVASPGLPQEPAPIPVIEVSSFNPPERRPPSPVATTGLSSRNPFRPIVTASSESSRTRGPSPVPEDQNGIIGLAISPDHPATNPERPRVASPAHSLTSARSGSPTLVRTSSNATSDSKRSVPRPNTAEPVMRSIFPRYNPDVPLSQQSYQPMITNAPSRIPRERINRPLNSPKYTPHGNIESLDDDNPAPRSSSVIPYYTPPTALDSLWNASNGQGTPLVQMYTLQIHRVLSKANNGGSQLIFGPSESQPFYTLSHSELPPPNILDDDTEDDADHELLITRHNPNKSASIPVAHFTISPTPASSIGSPLSSNPTQSEDSVALITTIYPKMAALAALETAAQSPAASHIALVDPDATSPAAERLAQDVLLGTAQRECCALVWTRAGHPQPAHFISSSPGTYSLHHPSLGVFPITHEGDTTPGLSPILGSAPLHSPRQRPRRTNKPTRISILNPYSTPPDERRPDTPTDDAVLARLDFGTDSLVLNVAAILRLENPYLIDVIVSTLLSVALAEEKRIRREIRFDAPPLHPAPPARSTINDDPEKQSKKKKKGFWHRVGKRAEKKVRQKVRIDSPIPLETWGATTSFKDVDKSRADKMDDDDDKEKLPFVTTAVLGLLTFAFKTIVWVLTITIKIVAGVVVKVSHWAVTKA